MTVSDLSPDALARLEAKLVADLEMVRKVRALLEEHRGALAGVSATTPPPPPTPAPPPAPTVVPAPTAAEAGRKSSEEILLECLATMPEGTFAPQDFRWAVQRAMRRLPETTTVKAFLNRMIRQGKVVVVEQRRGRGGSRYRSLLPRPAPAENPAVPADPPAVPVETPPGGVHSTPGETV